MNIQIKNPVIAGIVVLATYVLGVLFAGTVLIAPVLVQRTWM